MSQKTIGNVIDKLLSDEDLRIRFVVDRMNALAELCTRGFDLSGHEIDLFCQTDTRLWLWAGLLAGELRPARPSEEVKERSHGAANR